MTYRSEIDGLRALAVMPVLFFHAGIDSFSGGFVGVDIFFVISGYLITTILVREIENEKFSLLEFYERRARRILPALVFITVVTVIGSWLIMMPIDLRKFGNSLFGVASFSSNIVFWITEGYFSESSEFSPLLHTWSLAVEEQYYVVFPLFLLLVWPLGTTRTVALIVFIAFVSLVLSEWGWRNQETANFYLTPTRAWELLAGSIAAFIIRKQGARSSNLLSLIGLSAVVFSIFFYDESIPFPSLYALVPVLGVVFIILFADRVTLVGRVLSTKIIVGIGLVSYSAYLWHQPLFALTRLYTKTIELSNGVVIILLILTFVLAYLTWRFVEAPFRNRRFLTAKSICIFSSVALVMLGLLGVASKRASIDFEYILAKKLSTSDYVYFANIDERAFTEGRLSYTLDDINSVVMGSSRSMQVGAAMLKNPSMNLSVSGASIEDYIAFVGESVAKLRPAKVYLGADPWLFNKNDRQDRWKSSAALYDYWKLKITETELTEDVEPFLNSNPPIEFSSVMQKLYWSINVDDSVVAQDGTVENMAKKAYDGSNIYSKEYISKSASEIQREFDSLLKYAMSNHEHDSESRAGYVRLIKWLVKNNIDVTIVLSPYHPRLYEKMVTDNLIYLSIENEFVMLGKDLGVNVIGSYNPRLVGCEESEFYDGMHPKSSCMERLFLGI